METNSRLADGDIVDRRSSLAIRVSAFFASLIVLALTPITTIYLFHPDGAYLRINGVLEFSKIACTLMLMQIEPLLFALAAIAYAVFNRNLNSRGIIVVIALCANALIGFFWMVVRNEGGI